jgi:hypothetical protein
VHNSIGAVREVVCAIDDDAQINAGRVFRYPWESCSQAVRRGGGSGSLCSGDGAEWNATTVVISNPRNFMIERRILS